MEIKLNKLSVMETIRAKTEVLSKIIETHPLLMAWYGSEIISPTLPSSYLTF